MYILADTETNGLNPGQICQLSYIVLDDNLEILKGCNYFCMVEYMPQKVAEIHGFTMQKLRQCSKGKIFKDHFPQIKKDFFKDHIFVAHNAGFDLKFLQTEFKRCDPDLDYNPVDTICTMKRVTNICKIPNSKRTGYKYPRLSEALDFFNISEEFVLDKSQKIFNTDEVAFHDARFDIIGVYFILSEMRKTGDF